MGKFRKYIFNLKHKRQVIFSIRMCLRQQLFILFTFISETKLILQKIWISNWPES